MDLTTASAIILTLIAIIFSGLFSGTEIAFVQSSKVRMEIDGTRGGFVDRIIRRFSRNGDMFISTLLVGNNIVLVVYGITISILINPFLEHYLHNEALVLICNTIVSTGIILIAGEFFPKATFRINPNLMMRLLAVPMAVIYVVLYPISLLTSWISKGLMRLFKIDTGSESDSPLTIEQLDDYIEQSLEEKSDREEVENEVKIFRNAIDFKDTQMSECMIPRNEIVAVSVEETSREKLIQLFMKTGLSKIVVYREDIDDIIGYIHISEMFTPEADWREKLKEVIFTPETMLANKMMRRMLAEKRSMAIVIDEFGGTCGLATLEDLVEEIFGEIEDEHDKKKTIATRLSETEWEFSARTEIDVMNEEYGFDIKESEEYHTLAGYMLYNLEAIPEKGKRYEIGNLALTVLKMTASRIELVKVETQEGKKQSL
ncbi:MAG: hemolysin family protein [Muribaculaceae bacterium]|nr:hemolysin family protein [Muribaculaceae bacterium]